MIICQTSFREVLENSSCTCIKELFQAYSNSIRDGNESLKTFWMSYVDMVEIMQGLL